MRAPERDAIDRFWAWWAEARPGVLACIDGTEDWSTVVDALTAHVHAVDADLAWEFGKGLVSQHYLCVTSEGRASLRAVAARWLSAAPPADDLFEFHATRPASPDFFDAGQEVRLAEGTAPVAPADLRFLVEGDEERHVLDLGVWHPAFPDHPELRTQLCLLGLDWLLGEAAVERWVGAIEALDRPRSGMVTPAELADAVDALARDHLEPSFALLQGTGPTGLPVIVLARSPLKSIEFPLFDEHVEVTLPYTDRGEGELPSTEALQRAVRVEDALADRFEGHLLLAASVTHDGSRVLHCYADQEEELGPAVAAWLATQPDAEGATVAVDLDPAWSDVAPFA